MVIDAFASSTKPGIAFVTPPRLPRRSGCCSRARLRLARRDPPRRRRRSGPESTPSRAPTPTNGASPKTPFPLLATPARRVSHIRELAAHLEVHVELRHPEGRLIPGWLGWVWTAVAEHGALPGKRVESEHGAGLPAPYLMATNKLSNDSSSYCQSRDNHVDRTAWRVRAVANRWDRA